MKKTLATALIIVLSAAPSKVLAKGTTTKIVIEGPDLSKPIEITNRKILANFNVWTGPGTFSTQPGFNANAPSFIIDWSHGPITEVPNVLQKYQVSFYSKELSERPIYVVYYAVARSSEPGYVYLPGESEEWWRLNVTSIVRGVEGKWFHAWSAWESIARPLIEKERTSNSTHPSTPIAQASAQSTPDRFALTSLSPDKIFRPGIQVLLTPDKWGAQISPDKRRLVLTRSFSGTNEVWISNVDGSNLVKLTSLDGPAARSPRWSPDGLWIAFDVHWLSRGFSRAKVFVVSANGGSIHEIAPDDHAHNLVPNWSRDSRWVYFASDRSGDWQVWKAPLDEGKPERVTHQGGFAASESSDGAYVYYSKHGFPYPGVWRIPVSGGPEEIVSSLVRPMTWADWSLAARGIYFIGADKEGTAALRYFDFASGSNQSVAELTNPSFFLSVSNDDSIVVCASESWM